MNNLTPYISSEPPPITSDSFDQESYDSESFNPYQINDVIFNDMSSNTMGVDQYFGQPIESDNHGYHYPNFGKENDLQGSRNPTELYQYIENIVIQNNLFPDVIDSVNIENQDDKMSQKSIDGEFDDYIDSVYNNEIITQERNIKDIPTENNDHIADSIACKVDAEVVDDGNLSEKYDDHPQDDFGDFADISESHHVSETSNDHQQECAQSDLDFGDFKSITQQAPTDSEIINKCCDVKLDNFADFTSIAEDHDLNYFKELSIQESLPTDFADFSFVDYSHQNNNRDELNEDIIVKPDESGDDDFEDFAAFENVSNVNSANTMPITENSMRNSDQILKSLLDNIRDNFDSGETGMVFSNDIAAVPGLSRSMRSDSFISNQKFFEEIGHVVWKELTNYDYSPAFIFQWMQSATYERFMSSIGSDYRDMLSMHRATLPLYSVNLTPIEPTPVYNCQLANTSASSSSIDLTSKDESGLPMSERSSNIDFKNLEEEFIFDKFSSVPDIKSAEIVNCSNISTIVSSDHRSVGISVGSSGGIFKSILKPLNAVKTSSKSINAEAEAVLKELPDLSYMSSKVLMFPVISACDVEDNI